MCWTGKFCPLEAMDTVFEKFPPMRRKERALNEKTAIQILENGEYGILATCDESKQPYGVPLSYVYHDGNNSTFLFLRESTTVREYRQTLCRLKEQWLPQIRRILICHGPYLDAPISMIDDLISCCDHVMAGRKDGGDFVIQYTPLQNGPAHWAVAGGDQRWSYDGHFGNLIYNDEREKN